MTRSILSNWFGLVVLAASTALLTPIMIHHLGAVDYGVWVLASSLLDYYGLLDLGMRSAMFRYVALFRGGTLREEVDRTFSSALLLVALTAMVISLLSIGVALLGPRFTTLAGTSPRQLGWLLFLLGISVAVTFPARMLATYISAHQRWDLYNAAGIATTVVRGTVIIVVLKLGYGILTVAIAAVAVAVLSLGLHAAFVLVADSKAHASLELVSARRIRELFSFSMRSLLVSIGDYLRFYSDSAVIATVLNVGLVTPFNVATRLIDCFRSVVIAAGGPVLGTMTELDGGQHQNELKQMLLRSTRFLALLSILGGVLLVVDGRALLRLWVGNDLVSAYPILAVLALGYVVNLAQHPTLLIVIAKGKHGPLGWWTVAEGVANIVLSVIWGMSHGLLGVAMGTIIPMLVVKILIQPWYALKAAELNVGEYISQALARPIVVGLLFAFLAAKISPASETSLAWFVAVLLMQVIIFLVLASALGLARSEHQWLFDRGLRRLTGFRMRLRPLFLSTQKSDLH